MGAALAAIALHALGSIARPSELVLGCVALLVGVCRLSRAGTIAVGGMKMPRRWESLGPVGYLGLFGLFLGLGFVTTMPSPAMLVVGGWALRGPGLYASMIPLLMFAVGRVITTTAAWRTGAREGCAVPAMDSMENNVIPLARVEALLSICVGLILVVGGV